MKGATYTGWIQLGGSFPPTLNSEVDTTQLKPEETPSAYGIDCGADGVMKSGSCPTGTARNIPKGIGSYTGLEWYYNRLWRVTGNKLEWFAPSYNDMTFPQDLGKVATDADIVEILPYGADSMLVVTATGAHSMSNCSDPRGYFAFFRFQQDLFADGATKVLCLDGDPYVSNTSGVFSLKDGAVVEWTRPIRDSLGSFSNVAITANYQKLWIIGTSKFVIDVGQKKLFDYGTSGFLYTSRTLTSDGDSRPFTVDSVAFILRQTNSDGGTLTWHSKFEDGDWIEESPVELKYTEGKFTRIECPVKASGRTAQRYAMKITAIPSNVEIREIQVSVSGLTIGAATA